MQDRLSETAFRDVSGIGLTTIPPVPVYARGVHIRLRIAAAGLAAVSLLAACGSEPEVGTKGPVVIGSQDVVAEQLPASAPRPGGTAIDRQGKPVVVQDVTRIVSAASGVAEIISALGMTSALVGRDIASESPALADVPVVTAAHSISAEKVLAVKPTLFIIDKGSTPTKAIDQIEAAGVQTIMLPQAWTLADVEPRMAALAAALGAQTQLQQLLAREDTTNLPQVAGKPRVAFLYVRGTAAIYLLGGKGSGADSLLGAIGAVDVGAAAGMKSYTPLTPEALIPLKPDVLLVMTKGLASVGGIDGLLALPGVKQTPAAKARRVIAVDDGLLLAFGADTYALARVLAAKLDEVSAA